MVAVPVSCYQLLATRQDSGFTAFLQVATREEAEKSFQDALCSPWILKVSMYCKPLYVAPYLLKEFTNENKEPTHVH